MPGLKSKPGRVSGLEEHTCVHNHITQPGGCMCAGPGVQSPGRALSEEEEQTGTGMSLIVETRNTITCKSSNTVPVETRHLLA